MSDDQITRQELLAEVSRLRRRVTDLEAAEIERVQAEQALRESEALLNHSQEIAGLGSFIWDLRDDSLVWSQNMYAIHGLDEETFSGKLAEASNQLIHPDDRDRVAAEIGGMVKAGRVWSMEFRVVCPDGEERIMRSGGEFQFDQAGKPVKCFGVHQDITERVQVEEERRRLAELVDMSPASITVHDFEGNMLYFNQSTLDFHGYTRDEFLALNLHELDVPESAERIEERMQIIREKGRHAFDVEHFCKDGGRLPLHVEVSLTEWDGKPVLQSIATDLTERKRAEEALRASEERHRRHFENVSDVIYSVDAEFKVVDISPSVEKLLGYRPEELIGKSLVELNVLAPESLEQAASDTARVLGGERIASSVYRFIARDGTKKWGEASGAPLVREGRVEAVISVARDITERVQAEEALRETNRQLEEALADLRSAQEQLVQQERLAAVGQMAAGIAHDFNNILAVIVLYTQIALRDAALPPELRERFKTIDKQAKRATDLIQQILDFGRRAVLERQEMDLVPFAKEGVKLLERTLPESIEIEMTHSKDAYTIHADPTRVQQVLMNLTLNARDAMPQGGKLRIGLDRMTVREGQPPPLPEMGPGDWVCLSVADTGTGIAPEILPHIFEPFFTTKLPRGSGLGLAQVYGIVRQHEGYVGVETEMGCGTTFTTYWPALETSAAPAAAKETNDVSEGRRETVLVVEDNAVMREALVDCLEMLNYATLEAANGEEALRVLARHRDDPAMGSKSGIALVISDWVMPTMSGQEMVAQIQARGLDVQVVIVTGYPLGDVLQDVDPNMVAGWVQKPPSLEKLADAVAQALGKA